MQSDTQKFIVSNAYVCSSNFRLPKEIWQMLQLREVEIEKFGMAFPRFSVGFVSIIEINIDHPPPKNIIGTLISRNIFLIFQIMGI